MSFFSSILLSRRFYRHFTNSPTSKPGFLLLESVQKLAAKPSIDTRTVASNLPESLSKLFEKYDQNRPLPTLKGPIHISDIGTLQHINFVLKHIFCRSISTRLPKPVQTKHFNSLEHSPSQSALRPHFHQSNILTISRRFFARTIQFRGDRMRERPQETKTKDARS